MRSSALLAGGAAALGAGALLLTRPFARPRRMHAPPNDVSIYEPTGDAAGRDAAPGIVSPFHLHVDPMEGLLLINFEKDPDRIYRGFEPQAFDDDVHGRGMLVLGWRVDGRVDVFHEPALRLDPETYGIAGAGLHTMQARDFGVGRFELGATGAQLDLAFRDVEGRDVRLLIRETDPRPRRPFGLLAPMGDAATQPPALPLVFVRDFYFVRRAGSEIRIEIDGRTHRSDPIPLLLDGARVEFLRYAADPFIVTWNPPADSVAALTLHGGPDGHGFTAEDRGVRYELVANGAFREIRRMSRRQGRNEVVVEFVPPLPHLLALRDGAGVTGSFRVSADATLGTVAGTWRVARRRQQLLLEASPDGGWTPGDVPRAVRALFRLVSTFRAWPTSYLWRATIQLPAAGVDADRPLPLAAAWQRLG